MAAECNRRVSATMKMSSQMGKVVLLLTMACAILIIVVLVWQKKRYESAYATLVPNTPKATVLKRFGRPGEIHQCELKPSWDAERLPMQSAECAEEFWYFSRVSPEQWIISFDKQGRAISKYYFASP